MSLNIKNEEAHRLAKELADETGENMTEAVTIALRERLSRVRNTEEKIQARVDAIMALGREAASRMSAETLAMDVDDYLYDELGLPK
jgi:antitoxin VapB